MVDIVLLSIPSLQIDDDHLEPPLGLLYIAAIVRRHGFCVEIFDLTACETEAEFDRELNTVPKAGIYGITTYCTNYRHVKRCICRIRHNVKDALVVLGGPNASALPEITLKDSGCDHVIAGEGEDAFLNLAKDHLAGREIPPIIYGQGRSDLNTYPMPAWDLVDLKKYTRMLEHGKTASLISSRGCVNNCTHCNSVVMGSGGSVRYRHPDNVAEDIRYLKARGYKKFRFNDDNFTQNPDLGILLDKIKSLNITYRIFSRIEHLSAANCRGLSESGARHVSVGLESLNPDNLRMLGKTAQTGIVEGNLSHARQNGLVIRAFFMVGLPYDTDENIKIFFEKAGRLPFDEFSLYPLIPYPGTRIAREPSKYGYEILNNDFTRYIQIGKDRSTTFVLRHERFSERDVKRWHTEAQRILIANGKVLQSKSLIAV